MREHLPDATPASQSFLKASLSFDAAMRVSWSMVLRSRQAIKSSTTFSSVAAATPVAATNQTVAAQKRFAPRIRIPRSFQCQLWRHDEPSKMLGHRLLRKRKPYPGGGGLC
jgi:hypothetical protein